MSGPRRSVIFKDAFVYIATLTGENFFRELIDALVNVFQVDAAWITEYHKEQNSLTTISYSIQGQPGTHISYLIEGTPCERVIRSNALVHLPQNVSALFPATRRILKKFDAQSFSGFPLQNDQGAVIGTMALVHGAAATWEEEEVAYVFQLIKVRVQSELQRLKREREILNRENQLRGLINGVQDLLINLNEKGFIVMLNATAEASLNVQEENLNKHHISQFLSDQSKSRLLTLIENFEGNKTDGKYVWIPGTLEMIPSVGETFEVEGTLSQYDLDDKIYYTLVLRTPDERADSGEQVKYLINQTEYVREELEDIKQSDQMLGESSIFKRLLQNIYMVAHTDATVLVNGETGTGKELVARHIHTTSNRKNKPMISINCGAIPAALIESEFFGHAKGAFTGATAERKGRFQMADGGTIFLDEIGELPLDLQVKLLRVIQEGEFEPVGSSKTIKVDVRIIAATHRNLFELSKDN
ncbi:MAG TPA: sigma 54-interacting transcriptional regulator, partial [Cyclobacteriaceae bacterium]|nr:sigma 54-interacting transcriptional regulator [Cyclobacteriaceae bacterium]